MSNRYSNHTQPLLRKGAPVRPSYGLRRTPSASSVSSFSSDGSESSGTSTTGRSQSRRNSVQELATNPHALSCTSGAHKHACLSCTKKIGEAYQATSSNATPKPVKLPSSIARVPPRRASQERRASNASPGTCSKSKSMARMGLDRMKDACAICGVALSLPMVAGDYVCVIAGASVGILFVPFGIVAEMAALVDKPGSSVWRVPAFFGGLFGLLGYLFPPSIIASILGHVSIKRLVGSGRIADKTAMAIYALLNPGPELLEISNKD